MATTMMTMLRITNCDADDYIIMMMKCKDTGGTPRNLCCHEDYAHGCAYDYDDDDDDFIL